MNNYNLEIKEIKPYLSGYIRKAGLLLGRNAVPDDDAVHDIRVLMKKSRAALKLTLPYTDTDLQTKDIQDLKRVGQIMSKWRDTSVHRKTLKELKKEFPDIFSRLIGYEKIEDLMRKTDIISEPDELMKNDIAEIEDLLNKTNYRIRFYQMQKIDPVVLLHQLELSFDMVRNIFLECRNMPRPEKIHQFRKRSKDFLYQLYFFRPLNPSKVKSIEKQVERMTLNLGRYNDFYQLIKIIGYVYPNDLNLTAMDELVVKIREKQDRYLLKVWPSASGCFGPGINLVNLLGFKHLLV